MKGEIKIVRLVVGAGAATPAPPIGPVLGQLGLNIMDFCRQFNDRTKNMEKNTPLPVVLQVSTNKKYSFIIKKPKMSFLKELGIERKRL